MGTEPRKIHRQTEGKPWVGIDYTPCLWISLACRLLCCLASCTRNPDQTCKCTWRVPVLNRSLKDNFKLLITLTCIHIVYIHCLQVAITTHPKENHEVLVPILRSSTFKYGILKQFLKISPTARHFNEPETDINIWTWIIPIVCKVKVKVKAHPS